MRLPNPLAAARDVFTARNWDQVGAAEAFKRMCFAWGLVLVAAWMVWNALIIWA